jgi:hypothetical protein
MYNIEIEVRDSNGKIICDENGHKFISLQMDFNYSNVSLLELEMIKIGKTLIVWMPQNNIEIKASIFNSISGTWMCMFSYYANQKRFIEH